MKEVVLFSISWYYNGVKALRKGDKKMKKMLTLVLLLVLSFAIIGCEKGENTVVEGADFELLSTESFTVDKVSLYEYTHGEIVYIYKHIIGYTDERDPKPIYAMVSSKDIYELGETFTVATARFTKGQTEFDFRVIQFEDGVYDTSWHKYTEM